MYSNFDGISGLYGAAQLGVLAEIDRLWGKARKARTGSQAAFWKRAVVASVMRLLTTGLGS